MQNMFYGTTNLKPIFIGENWQIAETSTDMFANSLTETADQLCEPGSTEEWYVVNN